MAGESSQTVQTPEAPAAGTPATPAPAASKSGITFISRNGQPVNNNAQGTPVPERGVDGNEPTNASPSTVNNDANPQAPENQGTAATAGEPATQGEPAPGQPTGEGQQAEPDLLAIFSERSQGTITSREQAIALVDEVAQLRTRLAERPQIEFPNEQARQIYDFAQKFPGMEMPAARNFLHVQSLDVNKLDPKEAQFEAFALKKPNWTREQARSYFEEKYQKAYGSGEIETSTMAKMDHDEETQSARAELMKVQQDFAAAKPSQQAGQQQAPQLTPDQIAQLQRQVEEVTKDFGGVKYQFIKNDPSSTVNIQLEKTELQKFQKYLMDPGEFLKDLYQECTVNGVFSQQMYRDAMFELANRKKIREQVFNQGKVYGEVTLIKERKNTAAPKAPNGAPATKPQTFLDTWRSAVKGGKTATV